MSILKASFQGVLIIFIVAIILAAQWAVVHYFIGGDGVSAWYLVFGIAIDVLWCAGNIYWVEGNWGRTDRGNRKE